ncbi:hypothetical protein MKEN_01276200 [Mycena kentingensis (nom. inval.)]|nr:hypothetical protein MKEN_01276200 [Mycena kentingensis (nom. inval.)]
MPTPLSTTTNTGAYSQFDSQLTPRTPHFRRAEAAYAVEEHDDADDYNSVVHQQRAPLLSSSASDSFPHSLNHGAEYAERAPAAAARKDGRIRLTADKILTRLPLALYSSVAAILLILVFVSLREPETLKKYVGAADDAAAPATHVHGTVPPGVKLIPYDNFTTFPLDPLEYRAQCIAHTPKVMAPHPYWEPHEQMDTAHFDEQEGYRMAEEEAPVCNRTITYQLDGWAGLVLDLALIAQFAGLARERGATFFVDDTYWNRGKWTDHFETVKVGPEPGCQAPPPEEYVACPRTARHWIVNSRTARYHLGHTFSDTYEDPYGHNLNRLRPMYDTARYALTTFIKPSDKSAELIKWAREELQEVVAGQGYIGAHIRRGDSQPAWRVAGQKYVPTSEFVSGVEGAWTRLGLAGDADRVRPVAYIACDSPAALKEFSASFDADRVFSLAASRRKELRALVSTEEYFQNAFMKMDKEVRVQATRGMVVDFALLSGAWAEDGELVPDATVCGLSSVICKLAAVALGWDRAFGNVDDLGYLDKTNSRWVEVDNKGRIVPIWEAFAAP